MKGPEDENAIRVTLWMAKMSFYGTVIAAAGMPVVAGVGKESLNAVGGRGDLFASDIMENYATIVGAGFVITVVILVIAAFAHAASPDED